MPVLKSARTVLPPAGVKDEHGSPEILLKDCSACHRKVLHSWCRHMGTVSLNILA
jgi:hypothetical protein